MRNQQNKLVIVAHPDDEIIFFAQVLMTESARVHVVLVTDGNGDGQTIKRMNDFKSALTRCGVKSYEIWDFEDNYDKELNREKFNEYLKATFSQKPNIEEIYTHGPLGEYGHPHHIQICSLVHSFEGISEYSIFHPDTLGIQSSKRIEFSQEQWKASIEIMTTIYLSEYQKFHNLIPIMKQRTYLKDTGYVTKVIGHTNGEEHEEKELGPYGPYMNILSMMTKKQERPF
jgi:hypothetical protein